MIHEYIEEAVLLADALNAASQFTEELIQTANGLVEKVKSQLN